MGIKVEVVVMVVVAIDFDGRWRLEWNGGEQRYITEMEM